jgi:hypothetical protein
MDIHIKNEYSPQTGEGFEFWIYQSDQPMPNDVQFTRKRLNEALAVCARAGVYPLAFEPPHYAMSKTAYNELANHFTIYSGQVQMSDRSHEITLTAPFVFRSTRIPGVKVYPENLGYYTADKPFSVDEILARASRLEWFGMQLPVFFFMPIYLRSNYPWSLRDLKTGAISLLISGRKPIPCREVRSKSRGKMDFAKLTAVLRLIWFHRQDADGNGRQLKCSYWHTGNRFTRIFCHYLYTDQTT